MLNYDPNVFTPHRVCPGRNRRRISIGLLLMIAVSAGTFACVLALPVHSLHDAHHIDALE